MEKRSKPLEREQLKLIGESPVFRGISLQRLEELLASRAEIYAFSRGEIIFSPGHFMECFGIVLKGRANAQKAGGTVLLNTFHPGDCFGVATLFSSSKRYVATVQAGCDCLVAFFSGETMRELFAEENAIGLNYVTFLTSRIHFLNRKIDKFTAVSAEKKLALWLLEQLERGNPVTMGISYSKLAEMLDLGRSSLYRAMEALEEEGLLRREGKILTVTSAEDLECFAENTEQKDL